MVVGSVAERREVEARAGAAAGSPAMTPARKLLWFDRLSSLWTPVAAFAAALALYMIAVETFPCSYLWLQPALKV